MLLRPAARWGAAILVAVTLAGCFESKRPLHYLGDAELRYYKDKATEIDYACVAQPPAAEVLATDAPRTLVDRRRDEIWDMTLEEAIHLALGNSTIIRSDATFRSQGNPLYTNPDNVPSTFDPAIQETGVLFGRRGVEAALADFDAQFSTDMIWGRDERIQNSRINPVFGLPVGAGGFIPAFEQVNETGNFEARLEKQFAYGGAFAVRHNVDYLGTNQPGVLFPSSYMGELAAEYRHPLWAASGAEFTRIAGPVNPNFGAITGVSQGVVIARINQDITIADFEANVRNLVSDVEFVYWELYLAYRRYDTFIIARNSALRTWQDEKIRREVGRGDPVDEAQAREFYFAGRAAAEAALGEIYSTETRLRRLLGLPVNDCKVIRPIDEPITAEFSPDWCISLTEALTGRVELRRQKWQIKSLELQLIAAESLTNPRLDFVSEYRVNGFGDKLFGESDNDAVNSPQGLDSFYETISQGDQTGWNLGLQFSMPIGFRSARAQVRNYELRLAKARELLAAQELEISHELAVAYQSMATQFVTAQTNFNRRRASEERVQLLSVRERVGTITTDLVLRALADLADADVAYYTSLVRYNQSIADLHFRKGTLLEVNNVHLAEGEWCPEAYSQALRRAWARSHALPNPLLHTEPAEFEIPNDYGPGPTPPHQPYGLQPIPADEYAAPAPTPADDVPMDRGYDEPVPQRRNGPEGPRGDESEIPPAPMVRNTRPAGSARVGSQPIQRVARWDERQGVEPSRRSQPAPRPDRQDIWNSSPSAAPAARDPGWYRQWSE